jgi:hypothetical protein
MRHLVAASAAAGGGGTPAAATPLAGGGKRRRISASAAAGAKAGGAAAAAPLSLDQIVASRGRLDACRWFYEVLVLGNKGLVGLAQGGAYADIQLTPRMQAAGV